MLLLLLYDILVYIMLFFKVVTFPTDLGEFDGEVNDVWQTYLCNKITNITSSLIVCRFHCTHPPNIHILTVMIHMSGDNKLLL